MINNGDWMRIKMSEATNKEIATDYCIAIAALRNEPCDVRASCEECKRRNEEWLNQRCSSITHDRCVYCKHIEDHQFVRYCEKTCTIVNGTAAIFDCTDIELKEKKND